MELSEKERNMLSRWKKIKKNRQYIYIFLALFLLIGIFLLIGGIISKDADKMIKGYTITIILLLTIGAFYQSLKFYSIIEKLM